ncbi:MAG TPA: acyl-ACP--UDP-N-acetylglucosamine O-acyltransferase [Verrucomicrobiota bacterium]|nr:acyl-ACP--UDP-N-acetylglucosamine O-acyltransferase [Verrucomicrobiota bacterium]HNU52865.1 acyl-ACP--UDP-N-acetylglucosamine O-acyltransferase [Verrucomicrobiota bacterium]
MTTIHPTAVVDPRAEVGAECEIGPYCVVGPKVVLGDRCRLMAHGVVDGDTVLGVGNVVYPFACLGLQTQDLKYAGGSTRTRIGDGNTFREYVTVHSATGEGGETRIGNQNHLLAYCHVAHDGILGSHIIMSNVATLAGHVTVEDYAVIGGLAAVHQFCRIGRMSMIGGCAKVVQDVAPYMLADGNPARIRAVNKVGCDRNGVSAEAQAALRQAHRLLYREGLILANAVARIEAEVPDLGEIRQLVAFVRASERGLTR